MKSFKFSVFLLLAFCLSNAISAEVILVYPRTVNPADTFTYDTGFDSTFVLGRVVPPEGILTINEYRVVVDEFGAFLAFLPLRKGAETKSWNLNLIQQGDTVGLSFPYKFAEEPAPGITDTLGMAMPGMIEVISPNAHMRTMAGGSYYLFPSVGTKLRALETDGKFFTIDMGATTAAIENQFVKVIEADSVGQAVVGDGECAIDEDWTVCKLEINEPALWRADLSADYKSLDVLLYGALSAIDRIRFDVNDSFIADIVWRQEPDGLLISFRMKSPISRGYRIDFADDKLIVGMRRPLSEDERRLKGKIIIVDAGHGGNADGAIGPLGTREKDVTLRWSKIIAEELERSGATVVLTREYDETKSLYDRIEVARGVHADFFLSLHGNALPDSINPNTRSGSGTYYYQSLSRRGAEILHRHLLKGSVLRDDGLWDANFAVARPTEFPAVLIEAAYLILPQEERLLMQDEFLKKISKDLVKGLEEYFSE
jgi:N-acetylmuramoyl-L-alanine amidase